MQDHTNNLTKELFSENKSTSKIMAIIKLISSAAKHMKPKFCIVDKLEQLKNPAHNSDFAQNIKRIT